MPSEIVWLPVASRDIARLRHFIKSENPRAAQRAAKRIVESVATIKGTHFFIEKSEEPKIQGAFRLSFKIALYDSFHRREHRKSGRMLGFLRRRFYLYATYCHS